MLKQVGAAAVLQSVKSVTGCLLVSHQQNIPLPE